MHPAPLLPNRLNRRRRPLRAPTVEPQCASSKPSRAGKPFVPHRWFESKHECHCRSKAHPFTDCCFTGRQQGQDLLAIAATPLCVFQELTRTRRTAATLRR